MSGFPARRSARLAARLVLPTLALCAAGVAVGPADAAPPVGPTPLARPAVTGQMTQGARVTVSHGTWKGSGPITRTYRWYRCSTMGARCVLLRGVDGRSHVLGPNRGAQRVADVVRAEDRKSTRLNSSH